VPPTQTVRSPSGPLTAPAETPPLAALVESPRVSAVLDSAHVGDIEGALGRISVSGTDHGRSVKTRLLTLLAILGPGLIVMVGDNDAGGVATYAQAGQNYGYSLLWVLLLLIPVLIVNQEMVVRLVLQSSGPPSPRGSCLSAVQHHRQTHHPRFIGYERADTVIGSVVVVVGAAALMGVADYAARSADSSGTFTDAGGIAHLLGMNSTLLGALFAIVLLDASIVGAAAVTLSTSYAFGDVFGIKHSLHRGFNDAKQFYFSYSAMILVAAAITLIPGAPLGVITTAVQALAGLLLPSASVFLLLLCNDKEVLGPWVNPRWLNTIAVVIVGVLLVLSGILMATTLFPGLNVIAVGVYLTVSMVLIGVAAVTGLKWVERRRGTTAVAASPPTVAETEKMGWRMPPLALLQPVTWSAGTKLGMLALRGYLVIGAILLIVKTIQLSHG